MKKFYTLCLTMVALFTVTTAKAVESITELFGTWTLKANIEYVDASAQSKLQNECEVTIKKDPSGVFAAEIDGLFGVADSYQLVSKMQEGENGQELKITNPNGGGFDAWGALGLWMGDTEGNNPFSTTGKYGPIYYGVSADGQTITLPDFAFINVKDFNAEKGDIAAKVTGATLTLKEKEKIEIADLTGSYDFTATTFHDYAVVEGWPTTLKMDIVKKDDTNKNYDVCWTFEQFGTIKFDGSFDGNELSLPFSKQLVANDSIYLAPSNGYTLDGTIGFNLVGDKLSMSTGCSFVVPYYKEGTEEVDSLSYIFWYGGGIAKKPQVGPEFDYAGTYNVKGTVAYEMGDIQTPNEGKIVIEYMEQYSAYVVTEFFGYKNPYTLSYDFMYFIPDAEDALKGTLTMACLDFLGETEGGDYKYLCTRDGNLTDNPVNVTFDQEGNIKIGDICFATTTWMGGEPDGLLKWFSSVTGTKYVPSAQDWVGTHAVQPISYVYVMDGASVPTTGNITIDYYEQTDEYLVADFMGYDLYSMNYGGLLLSISKDDVHKATMDCGTADFDATTMEATDIYDGDLGKNGVEMTLNEDGTVTIGDFSIAKGPWGAAPTTIIASTKTDASISALNADDNESTMMNLNGLRVTDGYKGIVIKNIGGKAVKLLNK